jgi:alkanesulfonate monooxygenase SsuD/methylene tetrahydromethanopterin reductase-like flavin-dependent oxidoreductase (luciferase family)
VRVSLSITNYSWPAGPEGLGGELARVARAADVAGLDAVWLADHLIQADPTAVPDSEMLEAYTTLGYLVAHTRRVRLGTMVTGVTFRPPGLLIKAVTTLDVLSGGRAWLGVAPATSATRRARWAFRSHPSASASSGSTRRFGSRSRCGPATPLPTRGATTASSARWAIHSR